MGLRALFRFNILSARVLKTLPNLPQRLASLHALARTQGSWIAGAGISLLLGAWASDQARTSAKLAFEQEHPPTQLQWIELLSSRGYRIHAGVAPEGTALSSAEVWIDFSHGEVRIADWVFRARRRERIPEETPPIRSLGWGWEAFRQISVLVPELTRPNKLPVPPRDPLRLEY